MEEEVKNNKLKNLENYKKEIEAISKQKERVLKKKEIFEKQIKLLDANYKLVLQGFKYNDPKWDYEKNPDYINNLRLLNEVTQDENRLKWSEQLEGFEIGLLSLDNQVESLNIAIKNVEKELEEDE